MNTGVSFPETARARTTRRNVAILALVLTLPLAGCGIWQIDSSFLTGLSGMLLGGITLTAGLHGIFSKPVLSLDEDGIKISGYFFPNSNWNLAWSQISGAKLIGNAPTQTLWLQAQGKQPHVVESHRFERFEELLQFARERLEPRGHAIEVVQQFVKPG